MDDLIETPNPNQESDKPTLEAGSDEEAEAAFARNATQDEDPETPADEPDDEATEEASDGEPEEADDKGDSVEVEYEGKTYMVPPELQKAVLRQADYSRSMNEVSAQKKDYTQRIQTADKLIEGAEKYAEALAEVNTLDAQLKSFASVNWQELRNQNPAEFAATAAEMQMLRLSREDAMKKAGQIDRSLSAERQQTTAAARDEMVKTLVKDVPGWGEELGTKVSQYAMSSGYSKDDIQGFTDPRLVIALNKARKFDAIQDGKSAVKAKAKEAPPVVKPGALRPRPDKKSDSMARLRQSGSLDDAAKAFEANMK